MEQGFFKFSDFLESVLYLNPEHCGTEITLQLQPTPASFHIKHTHKIHGPDCGKPEISPT